MNLFSKPLYNLCWKTHTRKFSDHLSAWKIPTTVKYRRQASKLCLQDDDNMESNIVEPFNMKKAVVLTKFSRLEFEKRRHPEWKEDQLRSNVGNNSIEENLNDPLIFQLERRGSDYNNLAHHHAVHSRVRDQVVNSLEKFGIETKLVNRFDYTHDLINWADAIITTGGDGTFLMAASKITSREKPVIGINTDPASSVGHLCLPPIYSSDFSQVIEKLRNGQFQWMYRQRIRVTMEGENALEEPIELHDQQIKYRENRYDDIEPRDTFDSHPPTEKESKVNVAKRTLPVRALNEVFVGESLSSRVSYYEVAVDGRRPVKLKSSGLTVCTGTGSTSWSFNINKVTAQCVNSLCNILKEEAGVSLPVDESAMQRITDKFNRSLIFRPEEEKMAYTIRDPVVFGTSFNSNPRGFANSIDVRSRMFDACLVIDGALSYKFNDGAKAQFEINSEDALKTVSIN